MLACAKPTIVVPTVSVTRPARHPLPERLGRVVLARRGPTVVTDAHVSRTFAQRIVNQTLAFLATCGQRPDRGLVPSRTVDLGWHAFILHTADYAAFCDRVAGRFLHHEPDDNPRAGGSLADTVQAMQTCGFPIDDALWFAAGRCTQCYQGCHNSP